MENKFRNLTFKEYMGLSIRTFPIIVQKENVAVLFNTNTNNIREWANDSLFKKFAVSIDIAHCAMGVLSETLELREATDRINISEELADKCSYLSALLYINNNYTVDESFDFEFVSSFGGELKPWDEMSKQLDILDNKIIDSAKKELAYSAENKIDNTVILNYLQLINKYANAFYVDMSESLAKNINKLYLRFPNQFNEEDAIYRDINKERQAL